MSDFITDTFDIPEDNLEPLTKKVTSLNKKAVKNGLVPLLLTVGDVVETVIEKDGNRPNYIERHYPVSISGEWPSVNGWKCIAKIDHRDGINLIAIYDDKDVSKWRERKPTCDHCGHNKIKVNSYLIENEETGEILQIGKTCIKDYIKGDPKVMLSMMTWVRTIEDELEKDFSGGTFDPYYDVLEVAKASALSIRKYGFVAKDAGDYEAGIIPTAEHLNDYFSPSFGGGYSHDDWAVVWSFTDEDEALAKSMIANMVADKDSYNNFVITVNQLIDLGSIRPKFFGYIAGAVSGYLKLQAKEKAKEIANEGKTNATVGEIKKREDFKVTLENVIATQGYYGTTFIHKFVKDTGETIVWFASGVKLDKETGDTFVIKATVKKFDEFNGWKQTIVNRVVIQEKS